MPDNNEQTIVTEEIIDNSEVAAEDINPESPEENPEINLENSEETEEQEEIEGEPKDDDEEFDPNKMDFSENDAIFGKYDLSKFKDRILFDNTEAMEAFNQEAKKMEELGFTQEQVDYICESVLGLNNEVQQPEKLTRKEVQANLKKVLTIEEQRNYAATNNFATEALKGTELEVNTKEIMSNPYLVKLVNAVYRKASNGKVINKSTIPVQKTNVNYTVENAQAQYDKYLSENPDSKREDKVNFLTGIYKKLPEKEKGKFENIFDGLFNK